MSLKQRWNAEIPVEIRAWGEATLEADNVYRLIGERISAVVSEADFAGIYSAIGRPAISPVVLALIIVFQARERVGDRGAAELAVRRLDWLYALHLPLTWGGFHPTDLTHFRERLIAHAAEGLIFDKVLGLARALGFLKQVRMQRSDSTHIISYTEKLGRLELVCETLRLALETIERAAPAWRARVIPEAFVTTYGTRRATWQVSADAMAHEQVRVGQDGLWLLAQLDQDAPRELLEQAAIVTLRTVWAQQFTQSPDDNGPPSVALKAHGGAGKSKDEIVTPHDCSVRWFKKRQTVWEGYKAHVTETVEAGAVQLITDIELVAANAGDNEALAGIQTRLIARGLGPREHYVDQGYTSGTNLVASAGRGIELVGRVAGDTSKKPDGYRLADFHLDFAGGQATCPAGHTVPLWLRGDPPGSQKSMADFKPHCAACPFKALCAPKTASRQIHPGPYYEARVARRAEQQTAAFKTRLKRRAAVEGTISELVRRYGLRYARYRGFAKVRLQMLIAAAAANLHRVARALAVQAASSSA